MTSNLRSAIARSAIVIALSAPTLLAHADDDYDKLTPSQKAWVDQQMEASRCKVGLFEHYYQECILDLMPAAKNSVAASDVMRLCRKRAPCADVRNKKTGIIFNTTASECFKKHGYNVTLAMAAANIRAACYDLYPND